MSFPRSIFLVRHGHPEVTADSLPLWEGDPPLSRRGEIEGEALASVFETSVVERVYTSPARRAVETARFISGSTGARLAVDERLLDREEAHKAAVTLPRGLRAASIGIGLVSGSGLKDHVLRRIMPALAQMAAAHEACVAVTHGITIDLICGLVLGRPVAGAVPNGSWTELVFVNGEWRVHVFGRIPVGAALPDETLDAPRTSRRVQL